MNLRRTARPQPRLAECARRDGAGLTDVAASWPWASCRPDDVVQVWIDAMTRRVTVSGELDLSVGDKLSRVVGFAHELWHGGVTVDIGRVTFADVAGLRRLVEVKAELEATGDALVVTNAPRHVRRLCGIVGYPHLLEPALSCAELEAAAALLGRSRQ